MKKIGPYKILNELGQSDFENIYRAWDTRMDREVALKVLPNHGVQQPELVKYFEESARATVELDHPNIATVYDFGIDEGVLYMAMQLVHGRSLRQYMNRHKRLSLGRVLPILSQLAEALDYVESKGLVFEILNPADVILEDEKEPPSVTITNLGVVYEKATEYEERFLPHVFALAALVFEMLSGRPPDGGELTSRVASRYTSAGALVAALRLENNRIIEQSRQKVEIMQILAQAQSVRSADDWLKVQALVMELMQSDRASSETLKLMAEASAAMYREKSAEASRLQLEEFYVLGEQAERDSNWEGAVTAFEKVAQLDPSYREVIDKLALVTTELRRANLFDQAMALSEASDLAQACRNWLILLKEKWDYRHGDAVIQFIKTVEDLMDKYGIDNQAFQTATIEPTSDLQRKMRVSETIPNQLPIDSMVAGGWLKKLANNQTERFDVKQISEPEMLVETPEDPSHTTDWLNNFSVKQTERLDGLPEEEPAVMANTSEDPSQTTDWPNDFSAKQTERLDGLPEEEPAVMANTSEDPSQTHDWLNDFSVKQTERLDGISDPVFDTQSKAPAEPVLATAWLDRLKIQQTEGLDELPKSERLLEIPEDPEQASIWPNESARQKPEEMANILSLSNLQKEKGSDEGETVEKRDGKEMVLIPSGEFLFGFEKKSVFLSSYWIDKTPVTNAEYKRFLDANPNVNIPFSTLDEAKPYCWDEVTRSYPDNRADHPVVLLTLEDAQFYANWVGKRLPTEQEWEKAARGTDGRRYPWGNEWQEGACNTSDTGIDGTTPVDQFSPTGDSPYGCVDMCGNVWEWTTDEPNTTKTVMRGGSWRNGQFDVLCGMRPRSLEDSASVNTGFRLVLSKVKHA